MPQQTSVPQPPSRNGLFAQFLRYAQNSVPGISSPCQRRDFSHALNVNKNPCFSLGTPRQSLNCRDWPTADTLVENGFTEQLDARKLAERLKHIGLELLIALATGALIVGVVSLFMIQLANHGW